MTSAAADAGRLLAWAARPKEVPARHEDYQRVVARYLDDPEFAALADSVAAGAGLDLIVSARDGVIATAEADSPLRLTTSAVSRRLTTIDRGLVGAVMLAVARTAFPEPGDLDDPDRVATFTTKQVIDVLDRAVAKFAERSEGDGDVDDHRAEVWRQWQAVAEARPRGERRSKGERSGIVVKVCQFLADGGYLTKRSDLDGGTWASRARFRHAVIALTEDSELYGLVAGFDDHDDEEGDGT